MLDTGLPVEPGECLFYGDASTLQLVIHSDAKILDLTRDTEASEYFGLNAAGPRVESTPSTRHTEYSKIDAFTEGT